MKKWQNDEILKISTHFSGYRETQRDEILKEFADIIHYKLDEISFLNYLMNGKKKTLLSWLHAINFQVFTSICTRSLCFFLNIFIFETRRRLVNPLFSPMLSVAFFQEFPRRPQKPIKNTTRKRLNFFFFLLSLSLAQLLTTFHPIIVDESMNSECILMSCFVQLA